MYRLALTWMTLAAPAHADPNGYGHMMEWGIGFMFGPVLWLLVLGAVIAGVIWFARNTHPAAQPHRNGASTADALATLNMRLAKGEIEEKEYLELKRLLTS